MVNPINHVGPKKLFWTEQQGVFLFLEQTPGESPDKWVKQSTTSLGVCCFVLLFPNIGESMYGPGARGCSVQFQGFFFFWFEAATQLMRRAHQDRKQVVCSNKVGWSRLALRLVANCLRVEFLLKTDN